MHKRKISMNFDIPSALQCLRNLTSQGQKKEGWIAVCKTGSRYYFVDATTKGLTTCITENLFFEDYDSAKASLERLDVSDRMFCHISM